MSKSYFLFSHKASTEKILEWLYMLVLGIFLPTRCDDSLRNKATTNTSSLTNDNGGFSIADDD